MALNANKVAGNQAEKKQFPKQPDMEPGTYPVRLVQVIDMGIQPQRAYKGEPKPPTHTIRLTYEFVDSFMVDDKGEDILDKPRWISEEIPLRAYIAELAKSTQRAKALDPEEVHKGDFPALLGAPANCTITVDKKGDKTYVNIKGLAPMRARDIAKCPELVNPAVVFDLDDPDLDVFQKFPEWLREKIKGNLKYEGSKLQKLLGGEAPKPKEQAAEPVEEPADVNQKDMFEDEDSPW